MKKGKSRMYWLIGYVPLLILVPILSVAQAQEDSCRPYQQEEIRVYSEGALSGFQGGHTIAYAVKKNSDQDYTLYFDLDFWSNWSEEEKAYPDEARTRETAKEKQMRARVMECFELASRANLGDGKTKIRLSLIDSSYQGPKPRRVRIDLMDENTRSDSRNYAENPSCRAVIHEALHLAGLWDEYREYSIEKFLWYYRHNSNTRTPAFDCRARSTSLMGDISYSFRWEGSLRPAHIQALVFPHCGNKTYYSCVENAYKTSRKNNGDGCHEMEKICHTPDAWLAGDHESLRPQAQTSEPNQPTSWSAR